MGNKTYRLEVTRTGRGVCLLCYCLIVQCFRLQFLCADSLPSWCVLPFLSSCDVAQARVILRALQDVATLDCLPRQFSILPTDSGVCFFRKVDHVTSSLRCITFIRKGFCWNWFWKAIAFTNRCLEFLKNLKSVHSYVGYPDWSQTWKFEESIVLTTEKTKADAPLGIEQWIKTRRRNFSVVKISTAVGVLKLKGQSKVEFSASNPPAVGYIRTPLYEIWWVVCSREKLLLLYYKLPFSAMLQVMASTF